MTDLIASDFSKVGFLWKEPSDKTDGIFNASFFPAVIGMAEEGVGVENIVDEFVFNIFRAVVVSDRKPGELRESFKTADQSVGKDGSLAVFNF